MSVATHVSALPKEARDVLEFWFLELTPSDWFAQSDELDASITKRFGPTLEQAAQGRLDHWADTVRGRLALIIVLDQFSRNVFRGTARSYTQDRRAQSLALAAIENREDDNLGINERQFLYMPLMHAEDRKLQTLSVRKFADLVASAERIAAFASDHREIIDRFGRFPYRNAQVGREDDPAERAFIEENGNPFA